LAKTQKTSPPWAERVEFYLNGLEIGNGYSELTDGQEQEKRFKKDLAERKKRKMQLFGYDHEFIAALKHGLPQTAGMAIGVDRLIMALTETKDIHLISPFAL
jgi:lysyl-tRNA synthetase class 2